jgi:hypothetical protein
VGTFFEHFEFSHTFPNQEITWEVNGLILPKLGTFQLNWGKILNVLGIFCQVLCPFQCICDALGQDTTPCSSTLPSP